MFKNKVLLITGGTGTFGNAVLGRFLKTDIREIRVFSRDEKKQASIWSFMRPPSSRFRPASFIPWRRSGPMPWARKTS